MSEKENKHLIEIREKVDCWNIWKRKRIWKKRENEKNHLKLRKRKITEIYEKKRRNVNIKIYNQHILKTNERVGISNRNHIIFQWKRKAETKQKITFVNIPKCKITFTKGCSLRLELKFRNCHRAKYYVSK